MECMHMVLLKYSIIVHSISVVGILCIVFGIVWSMPDLPTSVKSDSICLPNEDGILDCGKTPTVVHDYLEIVITKEYEEIRKETEKKERAYRHANQVRLSVLHNNNFWEMKPSAKVNGKHLPRQRKSDKHADMTPIRVWRHGKELYDGSGFLRYGIQYRNGRLVVPVPGTYFIYAFVVFSCKSCDPSTAKQNIFKQEIYKFNIFDEEEIEVVSNVQTLTVNCINDTCSSYVSTLAELKAGDELSVKVSDIKFLKHTNDNYFGLNLI